jgi:aminopeptidase N
MDKKEEFKAINHQYGILCAAVGELTFRIDAATRDREDVIIKLRNLTVDAAKLQKEIKAEEEAKGVVVDLAKPAEAVVAEVPSNG